MASETDRLYLGTYQTPDLAELWTLLEAKLRTSPIKYNPIGLIEVPFNIHLEDFLMRIQATHRSFFLLLLIQLHLYIFPLYR